MPSAKAALELPVLPTLPVHTPLTAWEQALLKCSHLERFHYAFDLNSFKIDTNLCQAVFNLNVIFASKY